MAIVVVHGSVMVLLNRRSYTIGMGLHVRRGFGGATGRYMSVKDSNGRGLYNFRYQSTSCQYIVVLCCPVFPVFS